MFNMQIIFLACMSRHVSLTNTFFVDYIVHTKISFHSKAYLLKVETGAKKSELVFWIILTIEKRFRAF